MNIGIQLYTVRDELNQDFEGTLMALAQLGYEGVEFAWNYGGMAPDRLERFLDEVGLKCIGVYSPPSQILEASSDSYRYATALHSPYFTTGITDKVNDEQWPAAIEQIKTAAEIAAANGITLLYHNHWQELEHVGGQRALDVLLAATDPAQVQAELDTAWLVKGGVDPVDYIRGYAGRLPMLHVKDIDDGMEVTEIGNGMIDFRAVVAEAGAAGVEWLVYEQDRSRRGPLNSAAASIEALRHMLHQGPG